MKLQEAREYAKKWAAAHKRNSRGICMAPWLATIILDDRITELETQRNELLAACKDAVDIMKHISSFPVLRNDIGGLAVDRLEGAIYTGEEAITKAEEV